MEESQKAFYMWKNTYLIECELVEQYGYDCPYSIRVNNKDICVATHCLQLEHILNENEKEETHKRNRARNTRDIEEI